MAAANNEEKANANDASTTVLITGSNRGLGLEFCKQYADRGLSIIACCRAPDKLDSKTSELLQLATKYPKLVSIEQLDVTNETDISNLANKYEATAIDICILNAGIMGERDETTKQLRRIGTLTKADLLNVFETNVIGPALISQALLSNVSKSVRKQYIVITSGMGSIEDNNGRGGAVPYRVSKAGINMAMQDMKALDKSVHTILLNPGWVSTDMGGQNATLTPAKSVEGMRNVIDNYKNIPNGAFWNYTGKPFGTEVDKDGNEKYPNGKF